MAALLSDEQVHLVWKNWRNENSTYVAHKIMADVLETLQHWRSEARSAQDDLKAARAEIKALKKPPAKKPQVKKTTAKR